MAEGGIDPNEYRRWLLPQAALGEFGRANVTEAEAKKLILDRLVRGALSAGCYRRISQGLLGDEYVTEYPRIGRHTWTTREIPPEFWISAEIEFPRSGYPAAIKSLDLSFTCFGVRFDPSGLALIVEQRMPGQRRAPEISRAPPPIRPITDYNPRPVGTLEQIAPGLVPFRTQSAEQRRHEPAVDIALGGAPTPAEPKYPTEISALAPGEVTLREYIDRRKARTPRPSKPTPKTPRSKGKPITHIEFMDWYAALPPSDQARGYRWVWLAAQRHFQPRTRVLKTWAEELSIGRKPGRKSKA